MSNEDLLKALSEAYEGISDDGLMKALGEAYEKMMNSRDNRNYKVNEPQMSKLFNAVKFFSELACKCDGKIEPVELEPKKTTGSVDAKFQMFHISSDDIKKLCDVIADAGNVSVDDSVDGVRISVTVPDVFIPIKGKEN